MLALALKWLAAALELCSTCGSCGCCHYSASLWLWLSSSHRPCCSVQGLAIWSFSADYAPFAKLGSISTYFSGSLGGVWLCFSLFVCSNLMSLNHIFVYQRRSPSRAFSHRQCQFVASSRDALRSATCSRWYHTDRDQFRLLERSQLISSPWSILTCKRNLVSFSLKVLPTCWNLLGFHQQDLRVEVVSWINPLHWALCCHADGLLSQYSSDCLLLLRSRFQP